MDRKMIKKILSGMVLISPLLANSWDAVTYHGDKKTILSDQNAEKIGFPQSSTIFIQNGDLSVKFGKFWMYLPDMEGQNYDPQTTSDDKFVFLPNLPIFFPVKNKFYQYPGKKGNIFGVDRSEILKLHPDMICCLMLSHKRYPDGNLIIKAVNLYRGHDQRDNRYLFLGPTAKLHNLMGSSITGGGKSTYELNTLEENIQINGGEKRFIFLEPYIRKNTTNFNAMNLVERGGHAFSKLTSQGWTGWFGSIDGGIYGLPGIQIGNTENDWIETEIKVGKVIFRVSHIFLNSTYTKQVEKELFMENKSLPDGLQNCNTKIYGDLLSFYIKLVNNHSIKNDPVLKLLLLKLEEQLQDNPNYRTLMDFVENMENQDHLPNTQEGHPSSVQREKDHQQEISEEKHVKESSFNEKRKLYGKVGAIAPKAMEKIHSKFPVNEISNGINLSKSLKTLKNYPQQNNFPIQPNDDFEKAPKGIITRNATRPNTRRVPKSRPTDEKFTKIHENKNCNKTESSLFQNEMENEKNTPEMSAEQIKSLIWQISNEFQKGLKTRKDALREINEIVDQCSPAERNKVKVFSGAAKSNIERAR